MDGEDELKKGVGRGGEGRGEAGGEEKRTRLKPLGASCFLHSNKANHTNM
jgi:hypothetical protein